MDNREIKSDRDCIARAAVRVANYLDGHQVSKFDELNIWSGRSLHNDLVSAINTAEETPIVDRKKSIKKCTKRKRQWGGQKMTNKLDGFSMDIETANKEKLQSVFPECFTEGRLNIP